MLKPPTIGSVFKPRATRSIICRLSYKKKWVGPPARKPPALTHFERCCTFTILTVVFLSRFTGRATRMKAPGPWRKCQETWCGENLILLPFVAFNSNVKNVLFWLYPRRSGTPGMAQFSIRSNKIPALDFFKSFHKSRSFLIIFLKATYQHKKIKKELAIFGTIP